MKNIHLFETKNAYDAAKNGLLLPRVSYITENQDVKYNPTFDANGHDFVEIAGIKWATMNVGAESIYDYGLYFQWGDTQGYTADQVGTGADKKKFAEDWSDYKWYDTSKNKFKKYDTMDSKTVLDLDDDAVHAAWKGSWRMPTKDEFECLLDAVNTGWTPNYQESGVEGLLCTANDGSNRTLFFPACGGAQNGKLEDVGDSFYYWSNLLYSDNKQSAYVFGSTNEPAKLDIYDRNFGCSVRGVLDEK